MVTKLFRAALVGLCVLLLGSCNVLQSVFGSVFPSTLTLVKAQADLSKLIASGQGGSYNIRVVETGSTSYVVVEGSTQATGPSIFFYDLDLNLKLSLTGATAPASAGVMVDANGKILAGGTLYSPDLATSSALNNTAINGFFGSGSDGFVLTSSTNTNDNAINIGINSPNMLTFQQYPNGWTPVPPYPIGHAHSLSTDPTSVQVDAVLDDGSPKGNVVFVVGQSQSGGNNNNTFTGYFVKIDKAIMANNPTQGFDNYTDSRYGHRDNLVHGTVGFANGSIFAFDGKTSNLVRIDPKTGETQDTFPLGGNGKSQLRYAYRVSGGYFFTFDSDTRILTKYAAWW